MRWPASILLLCLPAALMAAGEGNPSPPLDAARRDLQAVQAGSEEARLGDAVKPTAPAMPADAMNLQTAAVAPPASAIAGTQKPKEDKSHWLLDAMEAQKKSPDSLLGDKLSATDASALTEPPESSAVPAAKPETPPAVSNPLTPFLDQWMTPQDYTLLGHPAASDPAASPDPAGPRDGWEKENPSPISGTDPKTNPYLAGLTDFSPPPAGPVPPPLPAPDASPAGASAVSAPATTPAPFSSLDDTEKYFPQLKNHF